jgi:hypothetical protein
MNHYKVGQEAKAAAGLAGFRAAEKLCMVRKGTPQGLKGAENLTLPIGATLERLRKKSGGR